MNEMNDAFGRGRRVICIPVRVAVRRSRWSTENPGRSQRESDRDRRPPAVGNVLIERVDDSRPLVDSPQLTVGLDDGRTNHRKGGPISICLRAGVPGSKDGPAAPPDGCMSGGRECGGGSGRRSITSSRSFLSPPGHHKARTTTGWNERGWHSRVRPVAAPAGPIARDIPLGGRESARGFRGLVPSVSCSYGHGHYNGNCNTDIVDVCCTTTTTTVESLVDS